MNVSDKENHIAIIGMSGRFPGADNLEVFWKNLYEERDTIHRFTDEELIRAGIAQDLVFNPNYVKARGILNNIDKFDADFFKITPAEAAIMDPQQRIFLEICFEALEKLDIHLKKEEKH